MDVGITRRTMLQRGVALTSLAAAPGLLAACGDDEPAAKSAGKPKNWPDIRSKEVVVAGFGGISYKLRREIVFNSFTEISGANVVEAPWDYGKFLAMVDSPRPEWDMIDFDGVSTVGLLQAGTKLAKLEPWVRRSDLVDEKYQDYCGGAYAYSVVLGATDQAGKVESWADLFDTDKFPGKRAFPRSIYLGTLEIALLVDGVPRDEIYPLDFERAFRKLDTIKDSLLFYDSYAQGQQFIAQGSAGLIVTANSRAEQLKEQGGFDYTFRDAILFPWGAYAMPAELPHRDAANALIDYTTRTEAQAEIARQIRLGPVVSAAFDELSDEDLAKTPNSPANRELAFTIDTERVAAQDADYAKRYADWVAA